ncbi:MAG: pilin [Patescibacteria group bacterium]|nr:pilin [Patescibacteria group bacterium]
MKLNVKPKEAAAIAALAILAVGLIAFAMPHAASALALVPECANPKLPAGTAPPVPSLNCLLQAFANIAQFILGVTGSFALLMFVYGGFTIVVAAGNSSKVEAGKTILKNAVIGIVIIFTASVLLQYGMRKLTGGQGASMIVGAPCESSQVNPDAPMVNGVPQKYAGTVVQNPTTGQMQCVGLCSELATSGYRCTSDQGTDECLGGLCHGNEEGMSCCRPAR